MFAMRDQLRELKTGRESIKATIITKISDIQAAYFDLVQQQHYPARQYVSYFKSTSKLKYKTDLPLKSI
jgi:hypothetical protein